MEAMTERCDNCRWWDCGLCRRHPPVDHVREGRIISCWPVSEEDDWCGEWRAKGEVYRSGGPEGSTGGSADATVSEGEVYE